MSAKGSESFLVLRAQAGDPAALDELLRGCQAALFQYLLRLTGNRADAEDVLQITLLQICRKLVWLRDIDLFRPWIYRIASRTAFRQIAKRRRGPQTGAEGLVSGMAAAPASTDIGGELRAQLDELLDALTPPCRAVVVLHYFEEMTMPEVASVLGIPLGTAKSRLSYGLARLRDTASPKKGDLQ